MAFFADRIRSIEKTPQGHFELTFVGRAAYYWARPNHAEGLRRIHDAGGELQVEYDPTTLEILAFRPMH